MSIEVRRLRGPNESEPRIETGIVQFGNDWPGVFIRGDNAFNYMMVLSRIKQLALQKDEYRSNDDLAIRQLEGLMQLLDDCNMKNIRKDGGAA